MVLDHIAFHTEEDFPSDLSAEHAATHMGYYWSWAVRRALVNDAWFDAEAADMDALMRGESGARFVLTHMAGGLEDTDFNKEGRLFVLFYYDDDDEGYGRFMEDYVNTLNTPALPSFYHVADTPENQALLDGVFDGALMQWRSSMVAGKKE
ncbi:hypothetical protein [Stenoxybacter acetivorans]|uniref:DUF7832 domain-containing protein n=1 Tax=Stenoxybacter acetivorans TaxID=422441 RepID=UPI00055AD765|nr:hypothetical protein [Stenoxybacter acetivorans]